MRPPSDPPESIGLNPVAVVAILAQPAVNTAPVANTARRARETPGRREREKRFMKIASEGLCGGCALQEGARRQKELRRDGLLGLVWDREKEAGRLSVDFLIMGPGNGRLSAAKAIKYKFCLRI